MTPRDRYLVASARAALIQGKKESKDGQHYNAANSFKSGLKQLLSVAVCDFRSSSEGIAFLVSAETLDFVNLCAEETVITIELIRTGKAPESVIGGNYHLLMLAHIAWLVECDEAARSFVTGSRDPCIQHYGGEFWKDYATGMDSLVNHRPFEPKQMKLKTWERYLDAYRNFMRAATHGEDISEALKKVDVMFEKRNRDKTLKPDHSQINGDGNFPVYWDFRRESLVRFVDREYRAFGPN